MINDRNDFDVNLFIAQDFLKQRQIIVGDDNGNFNAENAMTRAEFAKIICKFTDNEINYKGFGCDYSDVAPDFWGYNYVMSATQAGLLQGYGDKVFGRDDSLTEEQAIIVLCRMLGNSLSNVTYLESGTDENGLSYGFITAGGKNVMEITNLQKNIPATRGRVAKWLYQLYNARNNYYN